MIDFDDFLSIVEDSDFEEIPVDLDTFLQDERYLNRPEVTLSHYQRQCILASTQIYKKETLYSYLPAKEAQKRWEQTMEEVILQLGKGSGKDFMSAIALAYIIYLLLCLKDPARYYDKPSGDTIDLLNIAQNAAQATNVFFNNVSRLIQRSPWFQGKYETKGGSKEPARANQINFDKNVTLYSGHSEREAWEGYNVLIVVLDEIDGFAESSAMGSVGKSASGIYDMYRASVDSRFPGFGKILALSFPRYKGSWIQQRYEQVIAKKRTIQRRETLKIDAELPDGVEGNELVVEWDEDHIDAYKLKGVYALKRPTWEVHPTRKITDYTRAFYDNPVDTLSRTACMPPDAIDAFFKDKAALEECFAARNGVDNDTGAFDKNFEPQEGVQYYVHVDLARKHDRCAVALAHVVKWESRKIGDVTTEPAPVIQVDALRYWIPTKDQPVDFTDVRQYILDLARKGFNIRLVTFDQWESADMRKYLEQAGLRTDKLSVAIKHYTDFAVSVMERRLVGPSENLLIEELVALRIMQNGKIDHMRQGYKDLSDATCGAIFNAIEHTPRNLNVEVDVRTVKDVRKVIRNDTVKDQLADEAKRKVIRAPGAQGQMPQDLAAWLTRIATV
jgi:hypothetical protein